MIDCTKFQDDAKEKSILDFDTSLEETFYSNDDGLKTTTTVSHEDSAHTTTSVTTTMKPHQTTRQAEVTTRYITGESIY